MKKLFLLVFVTLLVGVATAEVIDSVSFNPARLGRYKNLKVSDTLSTIGCVDVEENMTVKSGDKVTLTTYGNIDIGYAKLQKVDMPNTDAFVPAVYLMGGALKTRSVSVHQNLNMGCDVGCSDLWVKAGVLDLGCHTLKVYGKAVSLDKEARNEGKTTSGLELGGNVIPMPATANCGSLSWYNRTDSTTNTTYQVLGCDVGCDVGCSEPTAKACRSSEQSERSFTASDPYDYYSEDDCDGSPTEYSGACTSSLVAQGMCTDYYSIGCSGGSGMTGAWYGSYEELSSWPTEYSGYSNCYLSYEKPSNPTEQGDINFANWVKSHTMVPGKASTACSEVYSPAGYGDLGCGFIGSGGTETASFVYYSPGGSCSKSGQTGSYYLTIQLNCTKETMQHSMVERVWKFWNE